jgi:hypothetical protein
MSDSAPTVPPSQLDRTTEHEASKARRRWGLSWLALCGALAVHVFDEASTGFLPLWNQTVAAIRDRVAWAPLPTFDEPTWLGGLILGIAVLVGLSPFVFGGARWIRPLSYLLSVIMIGNGLGHIAASIYLKRPAPGLVSSPLLLAAAVCLLWATRQQTRVHHQRRI